MGVLLMVAISARLFHLFRKSQLAGRPLPMRYFRKGNTCADRQRSADMVLGAGQR